jgi:hypothetical protein
MKDWSGIAAASGIEIPAIEMERLTPPLNGLEEVFRPLASKLTFVDEPATIFDATEEGE